MSEPRELPMPDPFPAPRARVSTLGLSALLVLVALAYWPGLGGAYVFDDFPNIVDNLPLHVGVDSSWAQWIAAIFSSPASDLPRPLAMLTFALNHALTGLDPYWMKLTNVGIHLLNTCLVFLLARQLLRLAARDLPGERSAHVDWLALWSAAAWALNPINLMAVLFVVQRMESLAHTFVFAGLWCYLDGRLRLIASGTGWARMLAGLLGGTVLGTLSKESAVLLPLYALAVEWALLRMQGHADRREQRLPVLYALVLGLPALLGLGWLLPKVLDAGHWAGRDYTLGERLLTEARVVVDYLHWTLLPNLGQLSLYHDDYVVSQGLLSPPATLLSLLLLALLGTAAILLRKRRPLTSLGLAWFLAAQLLTATIIPLELVFEHRNYFASLGLVLVLLDLCLLAPRTPVLRRTGIGAAAALLLLYAGMTALRAREWSDQLRFSSTEASKHPASPRATYDLARNLIVLSDYRTDSPYLPHAWAALERARAVPRANALPDATAILLAARTGTAIDASWWRTLQDKLRRRAAGPQEHAALASLVQCELRGECRLPRAGMVDSFLAALEAGNDPAVLQIYGNYALNGLRDPDLALRLWRDAARRAPDVVEYQVTLAKMMIASGRPDEAAAHIARIRALGRLGQNEARARALEELLRRPRTTPMPGSARPAPATSPPPGGLDSPP